MAAVTITVNPAVVKLGYMLEHPGIRRYSPTPWAVIIRPVRTISRKGHDYRSSGDV
jgi:hypothetical protein